MSFLGATFLFALVTAAGPAIIHMWNRRRFRNLDWAAMEFLQTAVRRSRRILEIHDLLLLFVRTLAVILFILALSQPFWTFGGKSVYGGEPVHAVLVIDNSLSMTYKPLDKTLLDLAKERAGGFVKELPKGSKISIVPLCAQSASNGQIVHTSTEDALAALSRIEAVDRSGWAGEAAEKAKRACREVDDVPTKRVVVISDMQESSWSGSDLGRSFEGLDDVQIVPVGPVRRNNMWISEFRLLDGIADTESPAVFAATIRYQGESTRTGVRVSLKVADAVADDRTVDLVPGQHQDLLFEHQFTAAGTASEPVFVPVRLELTADELDGDNYRVLVVPVVARLPVVFIDQYGAREMPRMNRYGETYPLRRLLAARTSDERARKRLIDVRHIAADEIDAEVFNQVRLAAIAGVASLSAGSVEVLREYVVQGGRLFIAAGADFDPAAWNETAWLDGDGILPAPLKASAIGRLPSPTTPDTAMFRLNLESLNDEVFDLQLSENEWKEIMTAPFFYKAVGVDTEAMDGFVGTQPIVMGRYDNGEVFAVRREIGKGSVIMMTSGCFPEWNNLAAESSVLILDSMLRTMLAGSLPDRNLEPAGEIVVPVSARDQQASFHIYTPGREEAIPAHADPVSDTTFGVRLPNAGQRGVYRVVRLPDTDKAGLEQNEWSMLLALNGPARESELDGITRHAFESRVKIPGVKWVDADAKISLEGASVRSSRLWKPLMILMMMCLLVEMGMLKESNVREEST